MNYIIEIPYSTLPDFHEISDSYVYGGLNRLTHLRMTVGPAQGRMSLIELFLVLLAVHLPSNRSLCVVLSRLAQILPP